MKFIVPSTILGAAVACMLQAVPAQAAATLHTYVRSNGNDGNAGGTEACASQSPCLHIDVAYANTLPGGVVTMLDNGEFANSGGTPPTALSANLNITSSVTIEGDAATQAVIRVTEGLSITVAAGSGDVVTFKNVAIVGTTGAGSGITFNTGKALVLDRVWITKFPSNGILFQPSAAASSGPSQLHLTDSVVGENGAGGVFIKPTGNVTVAATLDHATLRGNSFGLRADGSGQGSGLVGVEAVESVASANTNNGFLAASSGARVQLKLTRSVAYANGASGAVASGAQAFLLVSGSSLTQNATGLLQTSGSTVASYGNNDINFNTTNTAGTITPAVQQ